MTIPYDIIGDAHEFISTFTGHVVDIYDSNLIATNINCVYYRPRKKDSQRFTMVLGTVDELIIEIANDSHTIVKDLKIGFHKLKIGDVFYQILEKDEPLKVFPNNTQVVILFCKRISKPVGLGII